MEEEKSKYNKNMKGIIIILCILLVIYFGLAIYFRNHFYFGSVINGINVSGETVEEADERISSEIESYELELEERGDKKDVINASDISLKYNSNGETQKLKDSQNPLAWIPGIFNSDNLKFNDMISYDKSIFDSYFDSLSCFDSKNIIEPKNPTFKYNENCYSIVDEVYGNKVKKDVLYQNVINAFTNMEKSINLEEQNCYENPKYNKSSQEVINARDTLNKYVVSKITYTFGDSNEVLDGTTINQWLEINENFEVVFNQDKVSNYVESLSEKYDTVGITRDFTTSSGSKVKVSGGDYGWIINKSDEVNDLMVEIKDGQSKTKEPKYEQIALNHNTDDIGNTYVEINLGIQHLWFYINGVLIADGDVVTGNVNNNTATPEGTYKLEYKEKNATLKGEGYSTPVSFWMPFNGGIGIHDATWRSDFGGSIYMFNGSHGCINAPYSLANTIFNNIEAGTPVICYY